MSNKTESWRAGWTRFASMSKDEVRTRIRQEVSKRWDAASCRLRIRGADDYREVSPSSDARFFFNAKDVEELTALVKQRAPQERVATIRCAERICQHRFNLLGFEDLNYGPEIDWQLDAVHGKRAPFKASYKIHLLDYAEVGDHKITWELNRHQHLVTLAKAYCYTQDNRFAGEVFEQWYDWQGRNPYPIGINWASSLEVGLRSISWLWVSHLLTNCSALPEGFQAELLRALALNGRHVSRYLSTYFSPNTHLLGEGVALFFIGTLCPNLKGAAKWQAEGWEIILREAQRQVQADGMHFEQSVFYHVYALDFFLHARILAARNQIAAPRALDQTIGKMLDILAAMSQAATPPRLGDDDGGRLFNPRRNQSKHMTDPLALGAALFGRADCKAIVGSPTEEAIWLLGTEGIARFDQLPVSAPSVYSAHFEPSGICIMRSRGPVIQQMVIDGGPQGFGTGGHSHADALSLQLSVAGEDLLVDPGTFCYICQDEERDSFRGTAAHNTMQVDGLDQSDPKGPFSWGSSPQVQVERWTTGRTFDLFAGKHKGYCRRAEGVTHRRWIFFLKPRFWLIRDRAEGSGRHRLDLFWHLAPGLSELMRNEAAIVLGTREKRGLALLTTGGDGWSREIRRGWFSPVYGKKEPAIVMQFQKETVLPSETATLLLPTHSHFEGLGTLTKCIKQLQSEKVCAYQYIEPGQVHFFFFADGDRPWRLGSWSSDAEFFYFSAVSGSGVRHCILCQASFLDFDSQRVVTCQRRVTSFEWVGSRKEGEAFCSDKSVAALTIEKGVPLIETLGPGLADTQSGVD
jgi:hypothetical protein